MLFKIYVKDIENYKGFIELFRTEKLRIYLVCYHNELGFFKNFLLNCYPIFSVTKKVE